MKANPPVIIDYPLNRENLKKASLDVTSSPKFKRSIEIGLEAIGVKMTEHEKNDKYPMDDEYSMHQGDPAPASFYTYQFVQNEEINNDKNCIVCDYQLIHHPLLPSTVIGTIYYRNSPLCTFYDKNGLLIFALLKTDIEILHGTVNYVNGIITLTWGKEIGAKESRIVTSYEYNLECQMSPPIECPKCKHKFYDTVKNSVTLQDLASGLGTLDLY